jgi:carotenoid cleavage dioxygenase-like enzyme
VIGITGASSSTEPMVTAPMSRRSLFAGVAAAGLAATDLARGTAADRYRPDRGRSGSDSPRQSPNPYLTANFAPLPAEVTALRLPVDGEVPEAVRGGTLLRIGPNPVLVEDPASYHWFVGDGMVHSFQFSESGTTATVDHRSRWVRTDSAAEDLGEEPIPDQPAEVGPGNEANTNIVVHGGRILALLEVALPTEIRRDASTVGRYDFAGALRSAMTAHPKIDPRTQELAFFGMSLDGTLRYHVAEPFGTLVTTQEIAIPRPVMMHDFAITATQAVFLDLPVVYFAEQAEGRPFPAAWAPEHGARLGVMPRQGGDVTWIDIEPCYVFHTINAVDGDGGTVALDVVRYPTMFDTDTDPYGIGGTPPRLERWTIDPVAGAVAQDVLDDRPQEFPRADPRRLGADHRFAYTTAVTHYEHSAQFGTLLRHDLATGTVTEARLPDGAQAGEGIFVPATDDAAEDDGWVLATVYRPETDTSDLVVLAAQHYEAGPIATVHLPFRVPFGFHGTWIPAG